MMSLPSSTASLSPATFSGTPAPRRKRVSAEHTLNRVRENQRRHRARRRDYIATLEQQLEEAHEQLADARVEIQQLKAEAEECRRVGFDGTIFGVEQLNKVQTGTGANAISNKEIDQRAIEALDPVLESAQQGTEALQTTLPWLNPMLEIPSNIALLVSGLPSPISPSSAHADQTVPSSLTPPPCCPPLDSQPEPTSLECGTCATRPPPAETESTTLCSTAYGLIAQQNFRGIDADTIRMWLNQGYRAARRRGEGCRVENGALFRLLDYISGV